MSEKELLSLFRCFRVAEGQSLPMPGMASCGRKEAAKQPVLSPGASASSAGPQDHRGQRALGSCSLQSLQALLALLSAFGPRQHKARRLRTLGTKDVDFRLQEWTLASAGCLFRCIHAQSVDRAHALESKLAAEVALMNHPHFRASATSETKSPLQPFRLATEGQGRLLVTTRAPWALTPLLLHVPAPS